MGRLLEVGANAEVKSYTDDKYTTLHCAAHYGYKEVAKELLKDKNVAKKLLNSTTRHGSNPLKWAKRQGQTDFVSFIETEYASLLDARRRLIVQTPEPLVQGPQLTSTTEISAIAESSH